MVYSQLLPFSETTRTKRNLRTNSRTNQTNYGCFKITTTETTPKTRIDSPNALRSFWDDHIATSAHFQDNKEHLCVITLNTKYRSIGWNIVSIGCLNESIAHPREIFLPVIATCAYAFVLAHNHPSGDPAPSEADRHLTKSIHTLSKTLQITLLDHVIIGDSARMFSFKENGLI